MALYHDFEGAKNIHVLHVLMWGFGGHWRFLTRVWDLDLDLDMAFHTIMFRIMALFLDFEDAKNIHVLYVEILGFKGCWRFMPWVWDLDLDLR